MKLSIVTTLYKSAETIDAFYQRSLAAAAGIADTVEIVMVNDGSPDDSLARAIALHQADPRVVVVDLARNFGHHKAMMTGLNYARGDLVFLIDSDLEEEPECLAVFHARLTRGDCDVVYGLQESRRGGFGERFAGELFFSLVEALGDYTIPRNVVTARLMTAEYVRALVRHRDREFLIGHLWQISGYRQEPVPIRKLPRRDTTYSLRSRVEMAVKHITTTSTKLLYYIFYAGLMVWVLSIFLIGFYVGRYVISGVGVDGWTSLMVSVWFFGGLITLILGVLGLYIANVLSETKRRPYTVVRRVHRADPAEPRQAAAPPLVHRVEAGFRR